MKKIIAILLLGLFVCCNASRAAPPREADPSKRGLRVDEVLDVGRVPAEFPVGFCLLTKGGRQYVAYYDWQHRMSVAARELDSGEWQYQVLPSKVGVDSHNYVTMAADEEGRLHLSGNMHVAPLVYFRTARPGDIASFEPIPSMTGANERRCTYPMFMRGPDGALLFHYRDGRSGNGQEIFNVYDPKSRTWRRFLDEPLIDGRGLMNAYLSGPSRGPDGWFHLGWVWRDTRDCQTNHDPSYARSRDLLHWETITGERIALPITFDTPGTRIDPIPARGGIINNSLRIGFDGSRRPLASYHKFDAGGKTQVYVARFQNGKWVPHRITNWDYRWEFKGPSSIIFEIRLGAVRPHGGGKLALPYRHVTYGSGLLVLDAATLQLLGTEPEPRYPAELCRPESAFPGMVVRWSEDLGKVGDGSSRHVLRWETLPYNRDHSRKGPLPEPAMLRLYRLSLPE